MASGRVRAKYNLARDVKKSGNILKSSVEQAQAQNEAAADASFWGRLGGMGVGALAGLALTGGASLAVTAGLAGAGSYFGSRAGEASAGGIDTSVASGGFGLDKVSDINRELATYAKGVEEDRMMSAASDAFSIYAAGGGLGTGTGIGGRIGSVFDKTNMNVSGNYLQNLLAGGTELIKGGASSYAKTQGFDTAYEAYKNRDKI